MALLDAANGKAAWSLALKPGESPAEVPGGEPLGLTQDAAWVVFERGAARFQLADGKRRQEVAFPAAADHLAWHAKAVDSMVQPLLLKLDAGGRVVWQAVGRGERVMTSGKFLYATRAQISRLDLLNATTQDSEVPVHFRLYRVEPKDGRELREYYQPRAPRVADARLSRVLLLFRDELQMVGFFSF